MINPALFSSATDDWATPQQLFDNLDYVFNFTLDACASDENHKCPKYFTAKDDGLIQDWGGNKVFCNPPYGRDTTGAWIKKCYEESKKPGTVVVALVPSRTDTKWFQQYIYQTNAEVFFIKGRLKFGDGQNSAPFPSMIVIFGFYWMYLNTSWKNEILKEN